MLSAVQQGVKGAFKLKPCTIDNIVFRLHYKFTASLLAIFCVMICLEEYNKAKIKCTHSDPTDSKKQLERVIETYCFFMTTFTIPRHHNMSTGSTSYSGVGPVIQNEERVEHKYYQWVPYVLALQALSFYIPHYLWKSKEGGKLKEVVDQFKFEKMCGNLLEHQDMKTTDTINKFLTAFPKRMKLYRSWFFWLIFCEVLNLINLIVQIYLTDLFLGGSFLKLGSLVYEHYGSEHINPFDIVFPKVSKCTFQKYGPGGSLQTHDAVCILSLNIINEKMYLVLWYWYIILFGSSVLMLIHRFLSVVLYTTGINYNTSNLLISMLAVKPSKNAVQNIMEKLQYSEWFFLDALATHLDEELAADLLQAVSEAQIGGGQTSGDSSSENSPLNMRKFNWQSQVSLLPVDKKE